MSISTGTGDDGTTGLFSGERVSKTDLRVRAYGLVDELNSHLGLARASSSHAGTRDLLEATQRQLFRLGADLATPGEGPRIERVSEADIAWLEARIDETSKLLPPLRHFILPGGSPAAAHIHVARAVSRRCESEALAVPGVRREIAIYLNRLSDFLFMLARLENHNAGVPELAWRSERSITTS